LLRNEQASCAYLHGGGSRKVGSIPINRASMTAAGLKGQIHIAATNAGWVVTLGKSVLSIDGGGVPLAYRGRG
jgi:enoyl reductase-like protein